MGERNIFTRQPAKFQSWSSERVEPGTLGYFFKIQVFMIFELLCGDWICFFKQGKADRRKRERIVQVNKTGSSTHGNPEK